MVVSVIEITQIALLVVVERTLPLMARIIRHDAIVRKCWVGIRRSEVSADAGRVREADLLSAPGVGGDQASTYQ
jgi:hypothetical protein